MRKPLIAGNWKMYKTTAEAIEFAKKFAELYRADETYEKKLIITGH